MRTRCPACSTVFRATSEQLRLKAGKVRCGHCQAVFNAFDHLIAEDTPNPGPEDTQAPQNDTNSETLANFPAEAKVTESNFIEPEESAPPSGNLSELEESSPELPRTETTEESTQAARAAGLVAARELIDTKSYNRWAAGTLADTSLGSFGEELKPRLIWPFVLFAGLLILALGLQLTYFFRTEIVRQVPASASVYRLAGVDVPLSMEPDLVEIESSDLQSDAARGLLVLQANLANRASYPLAWPSLELTLTDVNDAVVSRRVLGPTEYLPYASVPDEFSAKSEVAVKLWIEAKEIGAAGYRLYVFYP